MGESKMETQWLGELGSERRTSRSKGTVTLQ